MELNNYNTEQNIFKREKAKQIMLFKYFKVNKTTMTMTFLMDMNTLTN